MKTLLFPASYPPVLGGLQTVAQALAHQLSRWGHEVQVITQHYPRTLPPNELLDGIEVYRRLFLKPTLAHLKKGRVDLFLASLYYYPASLGYLNHLVKTFQPEVINVHFPDAQIPFVLWLRQHYSFRLVVSLHGDEIERWFEPDSLAHLPRLKANAAQQVRCQELCHLLQEAEAVTACSRYLLSLASCLEPSVSNKGAVIHNGIEPERFQDNTAYTHPRPYVLAYGRLSYQKGFDLLLAAFARVAADQPDIDLIIAGDGEEKGNLQSQAQALGINGQIHFFGRARPQEIVQLLNGCRFLVVPSRWEPFGIVALEGLAAGKPVLGTRVGGLPEFVEGTDNQLVAPTIEALTFGMENLFANFDKNITYSEQKYDIAARHSWQTAMHYYEQILRSKNTPKVAK